MTSLGLYLLNECYGTFLCVAIIACFLLLNKNYEKNIIRLFSLLCFLVLTENIGGTIERYLGLQSDYSPWRLFLSWLCYLTAPAITLTITEVILRNSKKWIQWCISIPIFVCIAVTSTCYFGPWCFTINPSTNSFQPGPLIVIPRYLPIVYLFILFAGAITNIRKSRRECIIVLVGISFIIFNFLNERNNFSTVSFREITISLTVMAYFMYFTALRHYDEVQELNDTFAETEERFTKEMLDQSIETLSYTIDAKDRYTKGHSSRVAKYSRMMGQLMGKSDSECDQIYRAGLLHDIGKISVSKSIINKKGQLTDEEFENVRCHPERGAKILDKMRSIPYLQNGAMYHHERFDGTGYPAGLKGEEIPELARIISVADAYDAMTSCRSYRPTMDQTMVKQEIWKGMGTQFDPQIAKLMISLIDADVNYEMRENLDSDVDDYFLVSNEEITWPNVAPKNLTDADKMLQETEFNTLGAFVCSENHWFTPEKGFKINFTSSTVSFHGIGQNNADYVWCAPTILVYSSDNGDVLGPHYEELGVFVSTGYSWKTGNALNEISSFHRNSAFKNWDNWLEKNKEGISYTIISKRESGKIILQIRSELISMESQITIPENYYKDIYFAVSGEHCDICDLVSA